MQTCPDCLSNDLPDGARRCSHCGTWIDPRKSVDEYDAFRTATRAELSEDLGKHFASIDGALKRMQWVAAFVLFAAGGFAVYFTGITKENISQTTSRIQQQAEGEIEAATNDITKRLQTYIETEVQQRVAARMAAAETGELIAAKIETGLDSAVTAAVGARFDPLQIEIDGLVAAAKTELEQAQTAIGTLRTESETALLEVKGIRDSFAKAQELQVGGLSALVEVRQVNSEDKGGLSEIDKMVAEGVEVLTFRLGGSYYGPVAWKYLDRLRQSPALQFVLLLDPSGEVLGAWESATLAAALNPPNQDVLSAQFADISEGVPGEQEVPRWEGFAQSLTSPDPEALAAIRGFIAITDFVRTDWDNFRALDHLEKLGASQLPVLGPENRMAGIVDRSRLTTRMLLEIAARAN